MVEDLRAPIDVIVARPFTPVVIKPKPGTRGKKRVALRLNRERIVSGMRYQLVMIPYTDGERARRRLKHKMLAPLLPDEPGVEGVDYGARPQPFAYHKGGHLQYVQEERLAAFQGERPWAG